MDDENSRIKCIDDISKNQTKNQKKVIRFRYMHKRSSIAADASCPAAVFGHITENPCFYPHSPLYFLLIQEITDYHIKRDVIGENFFEAVCSPPHFHIYQLHGTAAACDPAA